MINPLPKLRFPEFQNAGKWEEKQLYQIAKPVSDKASDKDNDNILTLSGEHGLVLQSDYFGKKIAGDNVERYIRVIHNDFVYNDRTTKLSMYGSIKRLSQYENGIVSPIYKCFRFGAEELPVFWDWYFESGSHEPQLHGLVNEGARAGRFNISIEKFLSTSVWSPTPAEQQKIADCLNSLDELITAQSQKVEALQAYKNGLMQSLFPAEGESLPRLRFPEFEEAGEWELVALGSKVTKVGSGITPNGGDKNYKKIGRPFVRSQNVGWGELILDDVAFIDDATHSTFLATEIKVRDVLLNITGASIGRSAIADSRIQGGNVNQHVCIIRLKTEELSPEYLNQYLLSEYGQKQIDSFQAGGNRQGLNFAQVRSFSIPIPQQISEQQRIAELLIAIDEKISAQRETVEMLKSHKKGLMQGLFPSMDEV